MCARTASKGCSVSITELARECKVSNPQWSGSARTWFDGYKEFRIAVAQELGAVAPEFTGGDRDAASEVRTLAQGYSPTTSELLRRLSLLSILVQ